MTKQRAHKFVTKNLRKTCSSLVKIISDGENILRKISTKSLLKISAIFAKNKCKSANSVSSTVQFHGVDLIDMQIQN